MAFGNAMHLRSECRFDWNMAFGDVKSTTSTQSLLIGAMQLLALLIIYGNAKFHEISDFLGRICAMAA